LSNTHLVKNRQSFPEQKDHYKEKNPEAAEGNDKKYIFDENFLQTQSRNLYLHGRKKSRSYEEIIKRRLVNNDFDTILFYFFIVEDRRGLNRGAVLAEHCILDTDPTKQTM
jgi:hypothetical protein